MLWPRTLALSLQQKLNAYKSCVATILSIFLVGDKGWDEINAWLDDFTSSFG